MARQKKVKTLSLKQKEEPMTATTELDTLETEVDRVRKELEETKAELEAKKAEMKSVSVREATDEEMVVLKKQVVVKNDGLREKIERQKAYDDQLVTGKFINRRVPGQMAKLTYMKYQTDPVKWYELEDGKVYTIPRGFAEQIREHYYSPRFTQSQAIMDQNKPMSAIHEVDTSNKKYDFVPLNF